MLLVSIAPITRLKPLPPIRLRQLNVAHQETVSILWKHGWSAGWFPSTPLCCRNQSPRRHLSVRLSGGKAGQHILGGRLWWRISANIFSLVGVKPPTFSFGCNHGSHWQSLYYCIDLEERNSFICYHFLATAGEHGIAFIMQRPRLQHDKRLQEKCGPVRPVQRVKAMYKVHVLFTLMAV